MNEIPHFSFAPSFKKSQFLQPGANKSISLILQFNSEDCLMNKKMFLKFLCIFLVCSYVNSKCTVSFEAAKVCKFYRFDSVCDPDIIDKLDESCSVSKVTRNEKKCPIYHCTVSREH